MKDFFVSYNKADLTWAEWIAWQLEEAKYSTVIQAWDFRPGCNFVLEMQKASVGCNRTIAVLSPEYLGAQFTQPEWAASFGADPQGWDRKLLPVRVKECVLQGLLSQITYVDLVGINEPQATQRLLLGVQAGRAKPTTAPQFPTPLPHSSPAKPAYPGLLVTSPPSSPIGTVATRQYLTFFQRAYEFAINEMRKDPYSAERFAEEWVAQNKEIDFDIFKEAYSSAVGTMRRFTHKFGVSWDSERNMYCLSCKKPLKNSSIGPSFFFCSDPKCNSKHILRENNGELISKQEAIDLMSKE